MAIAPTKLGRLVATYWSSDEDSLIQQLRQAGLVRAGVSNEDLRLTFQKARDEHEALPRANRDFNSPDERVRVFLEPYLTDRGARWAVPLHSLDLPDDD